MAILCRLSHCITLYIYIYILFESHSPLCGVSVCNATIIHAEHFLLCCRSWFTHSTMSTASCTHIRASTGTIQVHSTIFFCFVIIWLEAICSCCYNVISWRKVFYCENLCRLKILWEKKNDGSAQKMWSNMQNVTEKMYSHAISRKARSTYIHDMTNGGRRQRERKRSEQTPIPCV